MVSELALQQELCPYNIDVVICPLDMAIDGFCTRVVVVSIVVSIEVSIEVSIQFKWGELGPREREKEREREREDTDICEALPPACHGGGKRGGTPATPIIND